MKALGYTATVAARTGVLLGGVKRATSSPFCNPRAAVRWSVITAQGNKDAGRDIMPLNDVQTVHVERRAIVHGCQDGSMCSLTPERAS